MFTYAPGYTGVSILDLVLSSVLGMRQSPSELCRAPNGESVGSPRRTESKEARRRKTPPPFEDCRWAAPSLAQGNSSARLRSADLGKASDSCSSGGYPTPLPPALAAAGPSEALADKENSSNGVVREPERRDAAQQSSATRLQELAEARAAVLAARAAALQMAEQPQEAEADFKIGGQDISNILDATAVPADESAAMDFARQAALFAAAEAAESSKSTALRTADAGTEEPRTAERRGSLDSSHAREEQGPHDYQSPAHSEARPEAQPYMIGRSVPGTSSSAADGARVEEFLTTVQSGHDRVTSTLTRRLATTKRLQTAWEAGDSEALKGALEAARDDSLSYSAMQRLQQHTSPLSPRALARLVTLAQKLAQSDCEDHAVAAMRFLLQALQVSWPPVAKALRNVATPKATFDACEDVVKRFTAVFAMVKTMSRSVRIMRTNGPLVPVCRKLKDSLEQALAAAGRTSRRG